MKIFRPDFCVEITENSEKAPDPVDRRFFAQLIFFFQRKAGFDLRLTDDGIPAFSEEPQRSRLLR